MHPDELFLLLHPDYRSELVLKNELVLEFFFWILAFALTWILLKVRPHFLLRLESQAKQLSNRRGLTVVLVIVLALALRALLLPFIPIPEPLVHDEYSYLFQASTFASGHITNPSPAGWTHFETFHINMSPTYHSMYPPAQAIFLAGAMVLHVDPWWGVWLSTGLMCGAMCWMLQGWVAPSWALLGGIFCVLRFATFSYWMNSYFGGSVAALGGALLIGALPRLKCTLKIRYALIFALGLGALANCRPYEGALFSLAFLCAAAWWLLSDRQQFTARIRALLPGLALFLGIAGAMLFYNWRCTGNPTLFPYLLNQRTYHITRPFVWQDRYEIPPYRHQVMRVFYVFHEMEDYFARGLPGFYGRMLRERINLYYDFYIWPLFILMFIAAWVMIKKSKWRIFPISVLILFAGLSIIIWPPEPHYGAPMVGAVLLISIYGMRLLRTWQPKGKPVGPMLMRAVAALLLFVSLAALGWKIYDPFDIALRSTEHEAYMPANIFRSIIQKKLEEKPGQHIIFVHYHYRETGAVFWMFNEPDPQAAKVIWAYDMGDAANQQFMQLYPGRQSWFVDKTDVVMPVVPYASSGQHIDPLISDYHSVETHGE